MTARSEPLPTGAHSLGGRGTTITVREAAAEQRAEWDALVRATPAADPLQAWAWGDVAATWGEQPLRLLARTADGAIGGAAQVLVRRAPLGRSVLYVPHGPLWPRARADGPMILEALLRAIRDAGRARHGIVAKLDPRAAVDDDPTRLARELTALGCRPARHDLQARTTRLLDLSQGAERLFAGLERDTRNAIRRSAREDVAVQVTRSGAPDAYRAFASLLAETGARAGFRPRGGAALERIGAEFAAAGDAYLALAGLGGRPIAGCLALACGSRAFYLYAASLREEALRHAYGSYAALWSLCEALIADGRSSLDLWGVAEADDPTTDPAWHGFSLFKRGFRGAPLRHPGTFDLVLDPLWYRVRDWRERAGEALQPGRRHAGVPAPDGPADGRLILGPGR